MKDLHTQEYILFDMNSTSIGVLLFTSAFDKKKKKYIYEKKFIERKNITQGQDMDFSRFFSQSIKTLNFLAEKVLVESSGNIEEVFIHAGAPWVISQKRRLHFEKEKEFIVDQKIIDSILEEEVQASLHHTRDFREYKDLILIDQKTSPIHVNGYKSKNPIGKKVRDIDINSLISVMSKDIHNSFVHSIERYFHRKPKFISQLISLEDTFTKLLPYEKDFLYGNIQREITNVCLCFNGNIKKIGMIPFGTRHIIDAIARDFSLSYKKAQSLVYLYGVEKLDKDYAQKIKESLEKAINLWFKNFYNLLHEIGKEYVLPHTFLIKGVDHVENIIGSNVLNREELENLFQLKKKLSLVLVDTIVKNVSCQIDFQDMDMKMAFLALVKKTELEEKDK